MSRLLTDHTTILKINQNMSLLYKIQRLFTTSISIACIELCLAPDKNTGSVTTQSDTNSYRRFERSFFIEKMVVTTNFPTKDFRLKSRSVCILLGREKSCIFVQVLLPALPTIAMLFVYNTVRQWCSWNDAKPEDTSLLDNRLRRFQRKLFV